MKVLFPDRILNRHVGGNTTYARAVRDGLEGRDIPTGVIPSAPHPVLTIAAETLAGLGRHPDTILHYSADTGPMVKTRARSVVTVHGVASRWTSVARNARQEATWRFRVARAIRSTDAIITVSEAAADDIAEVFDVDRDRITVIHHGIDVDAHTAPALVSEELASRLPARYALYVGNIEPRKNLVELVGAFESSGLRNELPLVIAGRPAWNYTDSMSAIEGASNVHYAGFVSESDRFALMQGAELFVFPSLYEGFGLPVLEALATGTPVVASRRGSLAEVAGPSRAIEDLHASSIANAVLDALADTEWQKRIAVEGPEWARTFKWGTSIDRHIDVYSKVLAS